MARARRTRARRFRRLVQTASYLIFLLFIAGAGSLASKGLRADWALRFSPFSGIGAMLSSWEFQAAFWPALVLIVSSIFLGRYFCGWLCPLGTTLDITDRAIGFLKGKGRGASKGSDRGSGDGRGRTFLHVKSRRIKYYVLTACLLGAFLGISSFAYFDPLSIAVRSFVLVAWSYAARACSGLFSAFGGTRGIGPAARTASEWLKGLTQARSVPLFRLHALTALALLALVALGLWRRRFWCRNLCPLGALYALAGKWSLTRRKVSDECIHCGKCLTSCPMDCISDDGQGTLAGECILCLNCQAACPVDAVRFLGAPRREQVAEVDVTRRGVAAAIGAAVLSYPAFRVGPASKESKGGTFIRPPLSGRDEEGLLQKCARCGQCMRVCPTNAIQPAGLEGGLESLWTPRLVPRLGYCDYRCDRCGLACPTGAIPSFTLAEKHASAIGLAYVDTSRCIPWRGWQRRMEPDLDWNAHNCGVCEEVCPVPGKAILFLRQTSQDGEELRLPYVVEERCVGCGFCENMCPVQGEAAIRVSGGFRQLRPLAEAAAEAPTAEALPAVAGSLRIAGPKRTYEGPKELFEYIDGGAEPYLKFNFVRVSTANYTADGDVLKADLWEFASPEDAFGAYARDRVGEPIYLDDESSVADTSLWARRGRYMLSILPLRGLPTQAQSIELAREILASLKAKAAARPLICRELPQRNLDEQSVRFARDPIHLHDIYISEQMVPDGTFGLTGSVQAAYGAYGPRQDGRRTGLILIEYADADAALVAASRLTALREDWGDKQVQADPYAVFKVKEGNFCAVGTLGRRLAAVFFAPSAEEAARLVHAALKRGAD